MGMASVRKLEDPALPIAYLPLCTGVWRFQCNSRRTRILILGITCSSDLAKPSPTGIEGFSQKGERKIMAISIGRRSGQVWWVKSRKSDVSLTIDCSPGESRGAPDWRVESSE